MSDEFPHTNPDGVQTAWTPGPWAVDGGSLELGVSAVTTDSGGMHERRSTVVMLGDKHPCDGTKDWWADNWQSDVALIALAPEMAELIERLATNYRLSTMPHTTPCSDADSCDRCLVLAMDDKLRQIGVTNENMR